MKVTLGNVKVPLNDKRRIPRNTMCVTCAYKVSPTKEEEAFEMDMFVERGGQPHVCHNDHSCYCRGSWEFTKRLGLH